MRGDFLDQDHFCYPANTFAQVPELKAMPEHHRQGAVASKTETLTLFPASSCQRKGISNDGLVFLVELCPCACI